MSQPETLHNVVCGEADTSEDELGVAASTAQTVDGVPDGVINELLTLLDDHMHIDFRPYRRRMIVQRVERRMKLLNLRPVERYLQRCQASPSEVQLLGRFAAVPRSFFETRMPLLISSTRSCPR